MLCRFSSSPSPIIRSCGSCGARLGSPSLITQATVPTRPRQIRLMTRRLITTARQVQFLWCVDSLRSSWFRLRFNLNTISESKNCVPGATSKTKPFRVHLTTNEKRIFCLLRIYPSRVCLLSHEIFPTLTILFLAPTQVKLSSTHAYVRKSSKHLPPLLRRLDDKVLDIFSPHKVYCLCNEEMKKTFFTRMVESQYILNAS